MTDSEYMDAGLFADFPNGSQRVITVGDSELLLIRVGEEVFAVHNQCTHLGKPLNGGRMIGQQLICPFHGACFELVTGKALSGPAVDPLLCRHVRVDQGRILISLTPE